MSLPTRRTCVESAWTWLQRATQVGDRSEAQTNAAIARTYLELAKFTEDPEGEDAMRYVPGDEEL